MADILTKLRRQYEARDRARIRTEATPIPISKTASAQQAWATIFASAADTLFQPTKMVQPYSQHPTVYAAISAIAQNIASLPLEMFRRTPEQPLPRRARLGLRKQEPLDEEGHDEPEEVPITDSIVSQLLYSPSDEMQGTQLIEGTMTNLELSGNAFWFLDGIAQRTGRGPEFPTRIDLWNPEAVKAIMNAGKLVAWEYREQSFAVKAPPERVVHFKYFNPYDRIWGLAPLLAATLVAQADWKAMVSNDSFFDNSSIPSGIITPKVGQILQADSLERMRDQLEARHQGQKRKGRVGAISAAVEFLPLGLSQKDMDFVQLLEHATDRILMVWKVPPGIAGVMKDANYNALIQQAKQFWHNHLPKVVYLEWMIFNKLCKPFGIMEQPYFKTEVIRALTEDQKSLSEIARNYFNMGLPADQINERLELGFNTKNPSMKEPWLPFSLQPADTMLASANEPAVQPGPGLNPANPPGDQNKPGDETGRMPGDTQEPKRGMRLVKTVRAAAKGEFFRRMSWQTLISKIHDEEAAFEKRTRDHFFELKQEVLRKLRRHAKAMQKQDEPAQFDVDAVLFDETQAEKDIQKRTAPIYQAAINSGVATISDELNLSIDFSLLTPEIEQFLADKKIEIADIVDGPALDRLRAALQEGLAEGESVEKIAARVEDVFAVERSRARRIARTEVAEAFNGGRYETMDAAGVQKIEWLSARDNRVRDSHQDVDGEVVTLGEPFSNGLLYPLDPDGPPEEVVNCRCLPLPAA